MNKQEMRTRLVHLNNLYRAGHPAISDGEYDALVEEYRSIAPDDELFSKGIIESPIGSRMEALPVPMFSLEKVKTVKALRQWLNKMADAGCEVFVFTPKYDGISLVVDEAHKQAWTRGDGVEGQRSHYHYYAMQNGTGGTTPDGYEFLRKTLTWGEAICSRHNFSHIENNEYKNARNMVAGLFNSENGFENPAISSVSYVRYGMDLPDVNKLEQLRLLQCGFANSTPYALFKADALLNMSDEQLLGELDGLYRKMGATYQIDGIVLEVDEAHIRNTLGRLPNGNPAYAVAFKREEWCDVYETTVKEIEWGVSKDGKLNPVIIVEPVEMNTGVTVSRVTGYNAKYMIENQIVAGSRIEIIRSGDVIPKHIRTVSYPDNFRQLGLTAFDSCPYCKKNLVWDETKTHLICSNPECDKRKIAEIVYFFRTMGCEGFEEATVETLYRVYRFTSISYFLDATLPEYQAALGEVRGDKVWGEIGTRFCHDDIPAARLMTALNVFHGYIAEKTAQLIIDNSLRVQELLKAGKPLRDGGAELYGTLTSIQGVGEATEVAFIQGLVEFMDMPVLRQFPTVYETPEKPVAENQMHVCMTGFRSAELEAWLKNNGYEVLNGVTKQCTVLVVADLNSTSSKMQKAQKMGIRIVDRAIFENETIKA